MTEQELNQLTNNIIGACIEVHRALGPGLLEKVYVDCLCHELKLRGLSFQRELALKYDYKGLSPDLDLRADLLVEHAVVLEIKSVKDLHPVYESQLLSYLKLSGAPVGLLINFNVPLLKNGIVRRTIAGLPKLQEPDDEIADNLDPHNNNPYQAEKPPC